MILIAIRAVTRKHKGMDYISLNRNVQNRESSGHSLCHSNGNNIIFHVEKAPAVHTVHSIGIHAAKLRERVYCERLEQSLIRLLLFFSQRIRILE